ncbi:HTH domain-containing protein [Halobacteriales archaeon Cl-PHB]
MISEPMRQDYRAELYVRSDTFGTYDAQQRALERMQDLEAQGVFDAAHLAATWEGVATYETDFRSEAIRTYEEFADWADANDFSLEPTFDRRPRFVPGSEELQECVVFPVVSLAIYEGETLQAVLPSTDELSHYTVHEALEGFERGDIDRWLDRFAGVTVDRSEPRLSAPVEP